MRVIQWNYGFALSMLIAASILLSSCNKKPTYATYEDCILTEIGSSQTQAAVIVIRDACRTKFPPSKEEIDAEIARQREESAAATEAAEAAAAAADAATSATDNSR